MNFFVNIFFSHTFNYFSLSLTILRVSMSKFYMNIFFSRTFNYFSLSLII